MGYRIPPRVRQEIRQRHFSGEGPVTIVRAVGYSKQGIYGVVRQMPFPPRRRNPLRLSLVEREEIAIGIEKGESLRGIARRLGRAASTISRDVKAQREHSHYRAWRGDERAEKLAARPKPRKFGSHPQLVRAVEKKLEEDLSPEQISRQLKMEHPENASMHISHETIYQALYVQGRGTLRKELARHLRRQRTRRKPHGRPARARITNMVNISQRPAEAQDRAVPGHWEGDLIMGKENGSAIGTLVERSTRVVMLLHLPNGHTADKVRDALTRRIQWLPRALRRTLTWDQGAEMSQHAQFTVDTNCQVYFCDPRSPWQRGSNENTNGLLRQYFPKGADLSEYTLRELNEAERRLNIRPRETLNWLTPAQAMDKLLR